MKSYISMAVLFALVFIACGKKPVPEYRIVYYPNKKNVKEEWSIIRSPRGDTMEQGVHKQYFWNGSTAQSEIWRQGNREGSAQAWYESGEVKWEKYYSGGKRQGQWRLSRKDGQPRIIVNYDKDVLEGKAQVWDRMDASVVKEAMFSKGNCVSGDCTLFEAPAAPADSAAAANPEAVRDQETVTAFLN